MHSRLLSKGYRISDFQPTRRPPGTSPSGARSWRQDPYRLGWSRRRHRARPTWNEVLLVVVHLSDLGTKGRQAPATYHLGYREAPPPPSLANQRENLEEKGGATGQARRAYHLGCLDAPPASHPPPRRRNVLDHQRPGRAATGQARRAYHLGCLDAPPASRPSLLRQNVQDRQRPGRGATGQARRAYHLGCLDAPPASPHRPPVLAVVVQQRPAAHDPWPESKGATGSPPHPQSRNLRRHFRRHLPAWRSPALL